LPEERTNFFLHKVIVVKREEQPPIFEKVITEIFYERRFEKHKSVFKEWAEDDDQTMDFIYSHDVKLWKCSRFVKVEQELLDL
jgi:hypothetical protein